VLGGYAVFLGIRAILPRRDEFVGVAAGIAAGISVILAALTFSLEYAIGGEGGADPATVAGAMVGVHALIGLGEGIVTAMVVGAVLRTRRDLVHGAHNRDMAHG